MSWIRFLPVVLTGVAVFFLAGALRRPSGKAAQPGHPVAAPDFRSTAPDPRAREEFGRAMALLADPARTWLQTKVWIRSHVPELSYQGEGVYHKAPGKRTRLEVRTRGGSPAQQTTVLAVSDGKQRWYALRTPKGEDRDVSRHAPGDEAHEWFAGVEQCLHTMYAGVTWVALERGGDAAAVVGVWPASRREPLVPRGCRLYLRGEERWPARVEWWGPVTDGGADELLLEVEYREPVWDQALSAAACEKLFTLPGVNAQ